MQPIIIKMRALGALIWVYLDDFLTVRDTPEIVFEHTQRLVNLLVSLGLEINIPKSVLTPVQSLIFLGFQLNLGVGCIGVPRNKITQCIQALTRVANKPSLSKRKLASVLGQVRSLLFAMPQLRLFTDSLAHTLKVHAGCHWNAHLVLDPRALSQVEECIQVIKQWKGKSLHLPFSSQHLFTDASDWGWGATMGGVVHRPSSNNAYQCKGGGGSFAGHHPYGPPKMPTASVSGQHHHILGYQKNGEAKAQL